MNAYAFRLHTLIIPALALVSIMCVSPSFAEMVVIPVDDAEVSYSGAFDQVTFGINAGMRFQRIDEVRIAWSGAASGVLAWENGVECPGQYVVLSTYFQARLQGNGNNADAWTGSLGAGTYPWPDSFNLESIFDLGFFDTWDFLLDGECQGSVFLGLNAFGFCTYDILETPTGSLSEVNLIIDGVRFGDLDADGDIDAEDQAVFSACMAGPGVVNAPVGCPNASFELCDLDRDEDVDLVDFAAFQEAIAGH